MSTRTYDMISEGHTFYRIPLEDLAPYRNSGLFELLTRDAMEATPDGDASIFADPSYFDQDDVYVNDRTMHGDFGRKLKSLTGDTLKGRYSEGHPNHQYAEGQVRQKLLIDPHGHAEHILRETSLRFLPPEMAIEAGLDVPGNFHVQDIPEPFHMGPGM